MRREVGTEVTRGMDARGNDKVAETKWAGGGAGRGV